MLFLLPAALTPQLSSGEIRGVVVSAQPDMLHTARVVLRNGQTIRRSQTGANGAFTFRQLPPGVYDLEISEDFFHTLTIRSVRLESGEIRALPPVALTYEGVVVDCNRRSPDYVRPIDHFDVGKGEFAGRVVDDHGHPLADARIRLYIPGVGNLGSAITSDAGRFSIPDVPVRSRFEIEVDRDGFFTEDFSGFEVQPGYESSYDRLDLAPCEKGRCLPALRPIRPLHACS